MNEIERRQLMEALISEIQIYEDRQSNGQWLKSIKFRLPIIEKDINLSLEDDKHVGYACQLVRKDRNDHISDNVSKREGDVVRAGEIMAYYVGRMGR